MRMRNAGPASLFRALAIILAVTVVVLLPAARAVASDIPMDISTQQTFNGKIYGFCFSGISAKAGSAPLKTITASCNGSFQTSTSVSNEAPLILSFFGPVTVTCPNGKVATTTLGSTGALFSLFLIPGDSKSTNRINYTSPCNDNNGISLQVSAWSPMGVTWVIYVSP